MSLAKIAVANLLEESGVAVTVTDVASGFPKEHLFDRDLAFPWTALNASGDKIIHIDQGASGEFRVTIALIAGHNLVGLTCYLEWSVNDSDWFGYDSEESAGDGSFIATAGIMELPIAGFGIDDPGGTPGEGEYAEELVGKLARYWRLRIIAPSVAPEVGELFLTIEYEIPRLYIVPSQWGYQPNVTRIKSPAGVVFASQRGDTQKTAMLQFNYLPAYWRIILSRRWAEAGDGQKPFWFWDRDDTRYWMNFLEQPKEVFSFGGLDEDFWNVAMRLIEAN